MKLTLLQIVAVRPALESLTKQSLPAKTSFRLAYLVDALNPVLSKVAQTQKELFERYAVKGTNGSQVPPETLKEYEEEMLGLLTESVSVDITPLTEDLFESAQLTPTEASTLLPFMETAHGQC